MNKNKIGPYIFIAILVIVLFFILGVRYGQKVEKTNKTIDYIISLTPAKTPTPPPIGFKPYSNNVCGLSFLYPDTLSLDKDATDTAEFFQDKKLKIKIDCTKKNISPMVAETKIATEEIILKNKKMIVKISHNDQEFLYKFSLKNSINLKNIEVTIEKNLYPLFEKSLEFSSSL
jgi:hypothetical protein